MNHTIHGGLLWQPRITAPDSYDGIVCADVNDAWYPPAPAVLETMRAWLPTINHSPDTLCRALKHDLAQHLQLDPDSLLIGAGSSELIHTVIAASLPPTGRMVIPTPTYGEYARSAQAAGASIETIELNPDDHFAIHLDALPRDAQLIALCNPNNPTGLFLTRQQILQLASSLPPETTLLIDEAYIDYGPEHSVIRDIADYPNLAVIRTFSKAFALAGLRIGYAALGANVCAQLEQRAARPPWPVSSLSLIAARTALQHQDYVRAQVRQTLEYKQLLCSALPQALPSQTHYFLVAHDNASELIETAKNKDVYLRDAASFGSPLRHRYLRITTQSPAHNQRILAVLQP